MSYSALGIPLDHCFDDRGCADNELCCENFCCVGADIDVYCGAITDEVPPMTITGKVPKKPGAPPSSSPPSSPPAAKGEVSMSGTVVVLAAAVAAVAWVIGMG